MTAHPTIFMVTHPVPTECIGREGLCDSQQIKIWIIIFFFGISFSPHPPNEGYEPGIKKAHQKLNSKQNSHYPSSQTAPVPPMAGYKIQD